MHLLNVSSVTSSIFKIQSTHGPQNGVHTGKSAYLLLVGVFQFQSVVHSVACGQSLDNHNVIGADPG